MPLTATMVKLSNRDKNGTIVQDWNKPPLTAANGLALQLKSSKDWKSKAHKLFVHADLKF
jgi:hypothetical protein